VPELISPLEVAQEASLAASGPEERGDGGEGERSELEAVRELVLRAHRDVVPELIGGDSIGGLLASVEPARAAYARLAEGFPVAQETRSVPAGGSRPLPVDPAQLPPSEKIRRGLAASRS
jgi:hypothetical protein